MAISNFPTPPSKGKYTPNCFPSNLIQDNRNFHTDISITSYGGLSSFLGGGGSFGGSIKLPMPRRINDHNTHMWSEISATGMAAGAASSLTGVGGQIAGSAASIGSSVSGLQLNPFMMMLYQRPGYKEHDLSWLLSATNEQESKTLNTIINQLKKAALPSNAALGGALWNYPNIVQVKFKPDKFLFKFKKAAIISVTVDHTAAGTPSFYKSGAPTVVGLTLRLKEIELWTQDNYQE